MASGLGDFDIVNFPFLDGVVSRVTSYGEPSLVAQLDVRSTGDQEVAGSIPTEFGNILSWRLITKYFLWSFSPIRWFKRGSCQFPAKECAQY